MNTLKTYFVSHSLGRAAGFTPEADQVCDIVNSAVMSNGDSLRRDSVQAELDSVIDEETQVRYQISIDSVENEIDDE